MANFFDIRGMANRIASLIVAGALTVGGLTTLGNVVINGTCTGTGCGAGSSGTSTQVAFFDAGNMLSSSSTLTYTTSTGTFLVGTGTVTSTQITNGVVTSSRFVAMINDSVNGIAGYSFGPIMNNSGFYYDNANGAMIIKYSGARIFQFGTGSAVYSYVTFAAAVAGVDLGNTSGGNFRTLYVTNVSSTGSVSSTRLAVVNSGIFSVDKTITPIGTTGAQTINKSAGTVNFAALASSLVVTNSLVTATAQVFCAPVKTDGTFTSCVASTTAGGGSFTMRANSAATAETPAIFFVIN